MPGIGRLFKIGREDELEGQHLDQQVIAGRLAEAQCFRMAIPHEGGETASEAPLFAFSQRDTGRNGKVLVKNQVPRPRIEHKIGSCPIGIYSNNGERVRRDPRKRYCIVDPLQSVGDKLGHRDKCGRQAATFDAIIAIRRRAELTLTILRLGEQVPSAQGASVKM